MIFRLNGQRYVEWLGEYQLAQKSYVEGFMNRVEALDALRNLRFRDDALKIEMLEWFKLKREHEKRRKRR